MIEDPREVAPAREKTLRTSIGCVGIGLHSGAKVGLTLHPGEPGSGIRFTRQDLPGSLPIRAHWQSVVATTLCTTLADASGPRVATVEHLMAALAACEIDNARIEVTGPELPVMDGSALPFVFLIECAGIVEQDRPRRTIEILKRVAIGDDTRGAALEPDDGFVLDLGIDFEHPAIRSQRLSFTFEPDRFKHEIAAARTFGFAEAVEQMRAAGLARGGSLKNAVVIGPHGVLNEEGLRFADEFVRHKLLDAVGDLYLAGAPLIGRFTGRRAGHALHVELLRALFADPSAWRYSDEPLPLPAHYHTDAPAARTAIGA